MHIDREALYKEYEPRARQWAASKAKWMQRDGKALVDANALEGVALSALKRAVDSWQGAGPFEGYARTAVSNAWRDDERKERRHRHVRYPKAKNEGRGSEDDEGGGDLGLDLEPVVIAEEDDTPVFRLRRKKFRGGDSVVVTALLNKEQAEAFVMGGLAGVMRTMGFPEEEIRVKVAEKNRRWQQQDRRHLEMAELRDPEIRKRQLSPTERFNALFRDAPSAAG